MDTPEWVIESMLRIDDLYKAPAPAPVPLGAAPAPSIG